MDQHGGPQGSTAAAHQAAAIFVLAGVFTVAGVPASPMPTPGILAVAGAHFAAAAVSWWAPWERWGLMSTASLGLVAIVLLSVTTWVLDGYAAGLGPMFVLLFAWIGLHFPLRIILMAIPLAGVGYATALLVAEARLRLVASTLLLIPIAAAVSLLISRTLGQLRTAMGQLHTTQRELQLTDRWRAALMATLAHDVRSPLTSVVGVLEIVEEDPDTNPKYRRLLGSAIRQTHRVLRLAMGILEVERVEQGKLRLDRREVNLSVLVEEVAALTDPERVQVDVPPDVTVLGDRERLEQVLFNLTNNALRHGKPPVEITARQYEGSAEVSIRDHGEGVDDEAVSQLFDQFTTGDRSPQSVGLGMWIVRLLVESHGGAIRYEHANPGARFIFDLPNSRVPTSPLA